MKKYFVFFLFCLFVLPLNAQRIIKYISFYPIPYGSHETIKVWPDDEHPASKKGGTAVINSMGTPICTSHSGSTCNTVEYNPSTTNIGGTLYIGASGSDASYFAGKLTVGRRDDIFSLYEHAGFDNSNGTIRSGNLSSSKAGNTYIIRPRVNADGNNYSQISIGMDSQDFKTSVSSDSSVEKGNVSKLYAGNAVLAHNIKYKGKTLLTSLPSCNIGGIVPLRIKGSEECKNYFVCNKLTPNSKNSCSTDRCGEYSDSEMRCYNKNGECELVKTPSKYGGWKFNTGTKQWSTNCKGYVTGAKGGTITAEASCTKFKGWTPSKSTDYTYSYACTCNSGYYFSESDGKCHEYRISTETETETFDSEYDNSERCEEFLDNMLYRYGYLNRGSITKYDCCQTCHNESYDIPDSCFCSIINSKPKKKDKKDPLKLLMDVDDEPAVSILEEDESKKVCSYTYTHYECY